MLENPYKARLELISLVQTVRENDLEMVRNLLESVISQTNDPLALTFLTAPYDDEPLTSEEEEAIFEAREDIKAGRVYSLEQIEKEHNL